jgi:type VI secretion system protein ImpG
MSFNKYFQEELVALRELGKEFAERNPALAPFLSTPGRDPDVERILEGFAFLSGRLRQKLDDEFPELTHSLFNLLWPNYLRPIPACSIIEYQPAGDLSERLNIPRGTIIESKPVEGTRCRFKTTYDIDIIPIRLSSYNMVKRDGQAIMVLRFACLGASLDELELSKLRIFIKGESSIAHTIYFSMLRQVTAINFVLRDMENREYITLQIPPASITPAGFCEDEGLYPYPANTFSGYRILQEYFCFPEKFLFVEIKNLEESLKNIPAPTQNASEFELHFLLTDLPENYESFRLDNWRLFCTPVVNLFPFDAAPIRIDQHQTEYRIVPDPRHPYHFTTYSVDTVSSWQNAGKKYCDYVLFESFEHENDAENLTAYYRLRLRPSAYDGATECYISIVPTQNSIMPIDGETISLELTCTNRNLPAELAVGDINMPGENSPQAVPFSNILPVTPSYSPVLDGEPLWRLISNMSLNYIALTDVGALKAVLGAYNFRAAHDNHCAKVFEQILRGMLHIRCEEADRIYRSLPLRGACTYLSMNHKCFSCEGDMFLFASVLNEFLSLYATVNSFHQLTVIDERTGARYQWPARLGSAITL